MKARARSVLGLACALALAPALAGAGSAQDVVLRGAADVGIDRRLSRLLEAAPLVVSRDTLVARGDTIRRSVLVLDATLIHEGVILGDLVLVDAGAFVRPQSVVAGDVLNVAGGLYRSELAVVGGRVLDLPAAHYRVVREPTRLVIEATRTEAPLALDGLMGLHAPTYDRVNGLTAIWGARLRLPRLGRLEPSVHGQAGWQTQRGDPTYAADFTLRRGATVLVVGHDRGWATHERWIRGDISNSLAYLWNGGDLRDYHEVERTWLELSRGVVDRTHRFRGSIQLRGQVEDAVSLVAGEPWFLWGSETRENPPIDDGRSASIIGAADLGWEGSQTRFGGRAEYEAARLARGGDFHFGRVTGHGAFAMQAFADHSLTVDFFLQRPVGARPLPRQRWSFVGGPNTLHTLPVAAHYGDHVVFVESRYIVPMPGVLAIPLLGALRLHLVHAAGMAWTDGEDRPLHQELALQAEFAVFHVRFSAVPDALDRNALSLGVSSPIGRRFPWER